MRETEAHGSPFLCSAVFLSCPPPWPVVPGSPAPALALCPLSSDAEAVEPSTSVMPEAAPRQGCFRPLAELARATGKHPWDTLHAPGDQGALEVFQIH